MTVNRLDARDHRLTLNGWTQLAKRQKIRRLRRVVRNERLLGRTTVVFWMPPHRQWLLITRTCAISPITHVQGVSR